MGSRVKKHNLVDIKNVTNATVGSEILYLGKQENSNIAASEISEHTGDPIIEFIP